MKTKAFYGTGVDISFLITPKIANKMVKYLEAYCKFLKEPLILNNFNDKAIACATHQICAILEIDGRLFP